MSTTSIAQPQRQEVAHETLTSTALPYPSSSTVANQQSRSDSTQLETPPRAPASDMQRYEGDSSASASSRSPSPFSESSNTENSSVSELTDSATDSDSSCSTQPERVSPQTVTYKLVGDNIDKNVRPRQMRTDYQTRSLHYFHTYAVCDRVDMSQFSNDKPITDMADIDLRELLPTQADEDTLRENFAVLVARTLAKYMPFFAKFCKGLERHIHHAFSHEMAQKSEVVSVQFLDFIFHMCVVSTDVCGSAS